MREMIKVGTILIQEGTHFPATLKFESEPYLPGWRSVTGLNGYAMDRKTHEAGWTFFCLAGETNVTVFGIDEEKMIRKALKQIVAKLKSQFNSLEITRVSSVSSRRFLEVRYVTVSAQERHIQESLLLLGTNDGQEFVPSKTDARPDGSMGLATGDEPQLEDIVEKRNVATIVNL